MMSGLLRHTSQPFFGMEGGIIHHDNAGLAQLWQQRLLHPCGDGETVAAVREEHGRKPLFIAQRHDEVAAFAIAAGDVAVDFLPPCRPSVRTIAVRLEPAFIDINKIFCAIDWQQAAQFTYITYAFFVISFCVSRRFF